MNLIQDKNAKSLSYYLEEEILVVTTKLIDKIKEIAFLNQENIRVCLHKNNSDELHNMVILQWKNQEFEIHKHNRNIEICQIIEGTHDFNIYSKDGKSIIHSIKMDKNNNPIVRINKEVYHLSIPTSKYVIFHEIKLGPFNSDDNIFVDKL